MATNSTLQNIAYTASTDLSLLQFTFVKMSGDDAVTGAPAAGGADAIGILQNDPIATQAASVAVGGQSKIVLGATLTAGTKVTCDAAGKAVAATAGQSYLGTIVQGGATDEIGAIVIDKDGVAA